MKVWRWAALVALIGAASAAWFGVTNFLPPFGYGDERRAEIFKDCADCPEMLPISAGSFDMGMTPPRGRALKAALGLDQTEQVRVRIARPFAIGRMEVTFDQWDACVADGGCAGYTPEDEGWGRGDRPVIFVSWEDAHAYTDWLSQKTGQRYRLASEAEWEYAARAGANLPWPWGYRPGREWANYGQDPCPSRPCQGYAEGPDQWVQTAPVGQFPANRWGLHDVVGNVYEWVEDCFVGWPREGAQDGSAIVTDGCETRSMRGGTWYSDQRHMRPDYRSYGDANWRLHQIGFRVARDME